jgi:hypothetical protein
VEWNRGFVFNNDSLAELFAKRKSENALLLSAGHPDQTPTHGEPDFVKKIFVVGTS